MSTFVFVLGGLFLADGLVTCVHRRTRFYTGTCMQGVCATARLGVSVSVSVLDSVDSPVQYAEDDVEYAYHDGDDANQPLGR